MKITPTVSQIVVPKTPAFLHGHVYDVPEWLGHVLIGREQARKATKEEVERASGGEKRMAKAEKKKK